MRIPLPKMMRHWREREYDTGGTGFLPRIALKGWAFLARRPRLYGLLARPAISVLTRLAGTRGRLSSLPLARGWTAYRDLPAPSGGTFQAQWKAHQRRERKKRGRKPAGRKPARKAAE